MAKLLKLRRGTTSQHSSFTGAEGEVTVDTTKDTAVIHDGSTAGGHPLAKESILIDEDNMSSNSATRVPSQQSVKAYADTKASPPASAGTVGTSETVQVDSNKDITGFRNVTLTGELDAATGDFSGDVDIDGTLEADAYTVDGIALNEYIADTVGAMVTGNTETGITVTYEDGDNTLDFVIGNSATTTEATNVTVVANNSTNETVYPVFVDGATGAQGIETDTGLTYNPSTGLLTTAAVTTTGNVTVGGNLQVDGTTTTVNSSTMTVTDKNIEIAKGAANDAAADGAGITIDSGDGDKTWNWVDATDAWTSSEHIHLLDDKKLLLGTSSESTFFHDNAGQTYLTTSTGNFHIQCPSGENSLKAIHNGAVELYHDNIKTFETIGNGVLVQGTEGAGGSIYLYADEGDDNADKWQQEAATDGAYKLRSYSTGSWSTLSTLDGSGNATFAGTVTDSKGDLRTIPLGNITSAHTLVAADAGKSFTSTAGVTFPNSVFTAGQAITIINNSASDITLTQGSGATLYNTADGNTGNRVLAARGMATALYISASVAYISGAGLS